MRHGQRLAAELGIDPALVNEFDMDSIKAGMGLSADTERLTYRDVQQRREIIRERLEEKRRRMTLAWLMRSRIDGHASRVVAAVRPEYGPRHDHSIATKSRPRSATTGSSVPSARTGTRGATSASPKT